MALGCGEGSAENGRGGDRRQWIGKKGLA